MHRLPYFLSGCEDAFTKQQCSLECRNSMHTSSTSSLAWPSSRACGLQEPHNTQGKISTTWKHTNRSSDWFIAQRVTTLFLAHLSVNRGQTKGIFHGGSVPWMVLFVLPYLSLHSFTSMLHVIQPRNFRAANFATGVDWFYRDSDIGYLR